MTTYCKDHKPSFHEMRSISSPKGKTPQSYQAFSWLLALVFLILVIFLYGEDLSWVIGQSSLREKLCSEFREDVELPFAIGRNTEKCNIFDGKWVYDNITRPHYLEKECPYIHPEMTCDEHGRPDKEYLHWRWQPHGCSLPSFNASLMLETLQGKRLLFVGDSLSRGQFISMVCLLHRLIPDNAKTMKAFDSFIMFTAKEYNAMIGFYWAPFLVESNSDDPILHRITDRIVREGSIKKHAKNWKGADIIVFNTYMWWMSGQTIKVIREPFTSDLKDIKRIKTEVAYGRALRSMVKWVDKNMDPKKSRVFFATMSPAHERSKEWGGDPNGNCYNETTPIEDPNYWGFSSSKSMMKVVREVFEHVKFPITVLNITHLSDYRKDAHVSIYKKQWRPLTPKKIANPQTYSDCIHWCLPGLQDTWNELLYAKLFFL